MISSSAASTLDTAAVYVVLVRYVPRRVDRRGVQLDQSFPESEVGVLRGDVGGFRRA